MLCCVRLQTIFVYYLVGYYHNAVLFCVTGNAQVLAFGGTVTDSSFTGLFYNVYFAYK